MAEHCARTFKLRHYRLPKRLVDCMKCKPRSRLDMTRLFEKFEASYPFISR
jgi:hypothetical protein